MHADVHVHAREESAETGESTKRVLTIKIFAHSRPLNRSCTDSGRRYGRRWEWKQNKHEHEPGYINMCMCVREREGAGI